MLINRAALLDRRREHRQLAIWSWSVWGVQKGQVSKAHRTGFQPWLSHWLALSSWVSYLALCSLNFLLGKWGCNIDLIKIVRIVRYRLQENLVQNKSPVITHDNIWSCHLSSIFYEWGLEYIFNDLQSLPCLASHVQAYPLPLFPALTLPRAGLCLDFRGLWSWKRGAQSWQTTSWARVWSGCSEQRFQPTSVERGDLILKDELSVHRLALGKSIPDGDPYKQRLRSKSVCQKLGCWEERHSGNATGKVRSKYKESCTRSVSCSLGSPPSSI